MTEQCPDCGLAAGWVVHPQGPDYPKEQRYRGTGCNRRTITKLRTDLASALARAEAAETKLNNVEADAQALADVRTLDEWAADQPIRTPSPSPHKTETGDWFIWLSTGNYFAAATPEGGRAKAAEWVRKQAPTTTEGHK